MKWTWCEISNTIVLLLPLLFWRRRKTGANMAEVKGIKELTDVVDLAVATVNVGMRAAADGSVDAADLALIMQLVPNVGPAFDGITEVPSELKDLSVAEAAQLVTHVGAILAVQDAQSREVVEAALATAASAFRLAKAIKAAKAA
jgi:hypothetical protein